MMKAMGEKDTIVNYPEQIEALVAAGNDPFVSTVNLAELRAAISLFGFRRALRVQSDELRQLTVPTLLVWGDHDRVSAVEIATTTAKLIPNAQLELLAAGHGLWLGYPDRSRTHVHVCPLSGATSGLDDPVRPRPIFSPMKQTLNDWRIR